MSWAYCRMGYQSGIPLTVMDGEVDRLSRAVEKLRQEPAPVHWLLKRQIIDNLMGRNEDPVRIVGFNPYSRLADFLIAEAMKHEARGAAAHSTPAVSASVPA